MKVKDLFRIYYLFSIVYVTEIIIQIITEDSNNVVLLKNSRLPQHKVNMYTVNVKAKKLLAI